MTPATTTDATPAQARSARHLRLRTPLGPYAIAAEGGAITGLWRDEQAHYPSAARMGTEVAPGTDALLDDAAAQLLAYIAGEREGFDLPLAAHGTEFQRRVWDELAAIPRGETTTYGAIAARIGAPRASQAVGAAVGRNPISIIVPCHRVLSSTGGITGYAGGLDAKRALLRLEDVAPRD